MHCVSGSQYKSFSTTSLNMLSKGKAIPIQAWIGPVGSRRFRHPEFLDNLHMEVATLSALHISHLYTHGILLVFISVTGWIDTRAIVLPEALHQSMTPSGIEPRPSGL
jgi:hypothetical protein